MEEHSFSLFIFLSRSATCLYETQCLFTRRISLSVLYRSVLYSRLVLGSCRAAFSGWPPHLVCRLVKNVCVWLWNRPSCAHFCHCVRENAVTCCNTCNCKKGSLHVHQLKSVGMKLQRKPFVPTQYQLAAIASKMLPQQVHSTWAPFLGRQQETTSSSISGEEELYLGD